MRVTNGMIINSTLNGLYNNMNALNKTFAQMTTGKKIQTVSDNPIIAGRALKLTTNVLETKQYQSNVKEAESWTEITDSALENVTKIMKKIRDQCVYGSTGTLDTSNKDSIRTEIGQLWAQIQQELNATYAGRYVFSGYKTNEPMILTQAYDVKDTDLKFNTDLVLGSNSKLEKESVLEKGSVISKDSVLGKGTVAEGGFTLGKGTVISEADAQAIIGFTENAAGDKCQLNQDKTFAKDTKITKEQAEALERITGKKIVPEDYATGRITLEEDITVNAATDIDKEDFGTVFGLKSTTNSNDPTGKYYTLTETATITNDYTFTKEVTVGAGSNFNGKVTLKEDSTLAANSMLAAGSLIKDGSTIGKGTINPEVLGKIKNHKIEYEIGVNTTIVINSEGMDQIALEMSKKFNEIFLEMDRALADDTVTQEELHEMFTRKLDEIDAISGQVSEVSSDLGSRMNRLDYTTSRLSEQKISYSNLLASTEDVDIEEAYTNFNVQYMTYQSALQATSKIITNTLADYL